MKVPLYQRSCILISLSDIKSLMLLTTLTAPFCSCSSVVSAQQLTQLLNYTTTNRIIPCTCDLNNYATRQSHNYGVSANAHLFVMYQQVLSSSLDTISKSGYSESSSIPHVDPLDHQCDNPWVVLETLGNLSQPLSSQLLQHQYTQIDGLKFGRLHHSSITLPSCWEVTCSAYQSSNIA